jgi:hypothetical protein
MTSKEQEEEKEESVAASTNAVVAGGHFAHEQKNKTSVEHAQNDTTHGTYEPWQGVCTG